MKQGFNAIAFAYDRLTSVVFGKAIAHSQLHFLQKLNASQSLLVLGGGTGWWMKDLLRDNPFISITFIDASSEMIRIAKSKLQNEEIDRVDFICGTQNDIPHKKYDAVVLFYFLDLFSNEALPSIIATIKDKLTSNALWLTADFVNHRWWHAMLLKWMYTFFNIVAGVPVKVLPDWQVLLRDHHLTQAEHHTFYKGFIYSSVYHQHH